MSFRLGKIWGFPVEIDISWFIIFALFAWSLSTRVFPTLLPGGAASINWTLGVIAALLLFASVLVHELAHSYVAIKNGLPIGGITLFLFGGVSKMMEEPRSPGLELRMSAAGPLTSLVLGGLFWAFSNGARAVGLPAPVIAVAGYLAIINVLLAIFNMLPGFPLDGGRVLRAILWQSTGSLDRATRYASYSGQAFGYLFMLMGVFILFSGNFLGGIWIGVIGWFLVSMAQTAYQQLVVRRALSGVTVERIMQREVPAIDPQLTLRDLVDQYFMRHDYAAYPVVEGERLLGIVTVEDVRDTPREEWDTTTVVEAARPADAHRTIDESEDAWHALSQMLQEDVRRLLVVRDGRLEGVVSRDGVLRVVRTKLQLGT